MTTFEITSTQNSELAQLIAERKRSAIEWGHPQTFDLSTEEDQQRLTEHFQNGAVETVHDEIDLIADDVFELTHPNKRSDDAARLSFVEDIKAQGMSYGKWFLMPWSKELVRYPDQETHRDLRTFRNRNLVTKEEQDRLYEAKVAVFGLSVGSKVVEQLVGSGIGGTIIIGDPDHVSPSNLNRLSGGLPDVGMKKIHKAARDISLVDPYLNQVHFNDGITPENLDRLAELQPDIIFDEVDDIRMKAMLRKFAGEQRVPLVMATDLGDRSMIDVERHDLGRVAPFGGRVKQDVFEKLVTGECSPEELKKLMVKIVGLRHVTTRMLESVMEENKTLAGLPQLGDTAAIGGGLASKVAREIILSRKVDTGRYVHNPKRILELEPQATALHGMKTALNFVKASKKQKA